MGDITSYCQNAENDDKNKLLTGHDDESPKVYRFIDIILKNAEITNLSFKNELPQSVKDVIQQKSQFLKNQNLVTWKISQPQPGYLNAVTQKLQNDSRIGFYNITENGEFIKYYQGKINEQGKASDENALYVHANAASYKGRINNNVAEGKGFFKNNALSYDGEWQKDLPNGKGIMKNRKGTYEGQFKDGKIQGQGKFLSENNKFSFEGNFKQSLFHGFGVMKSEYETYKGDFENDNRHGKGKWVNNLTGEQYDGQWNNNEMEGDGKFTFNNKCYYEGQFKGNKPNGKGRYNNKSGINEGVWINGCNIVILNRNPL